MELTSACQRYERNVHQILAENAKTIILFQTGPFHRDGTPLRRGAGSSTGVPVLREVGL